MVKTLAVVKRPAKRLRGGARSCAYNDVVNPAKIIWVVPLQRTSPLLNRVIANEIEYHCLNITLETSIFIPVSILPAHLAVSRQTSDIAPMQIDHGETIVTEHIYLLPYNRDYQTVCIPPTTA